MSTVKHLVAPLQIAIFNILTAQIEQKGEKRQNPSSLWNNIFVYGEDVSYHSIWFNKKLIGNSYAEFGGREDPGKNKGGDTMSCRANRMNTTEIR